MAIILKIIFYYYQLLCLSGEICDLNFRSTQDFIFQINQQHQTEQITNLTEIVYQCNETSKKLIITCQNNYSILFDHFPIKFEEIIFINCNIIMQKVDLVSQNITMQFYKDFHEALNILITDLDLINQIYLFIYTRTSNIILNKINKQSLDPHAQLIQFQNHQNNSEINLSLKLFDCNLPEIQYILRFFHLSIINIISIQIQNSVFEQFFCHVLLIQDVELRQINVFSMKFKNISAKNIFFILNLFSSNSSLVQILIQNIIMKNSEFQSFFVLQYQTVLVSIKFEKMIASNMNIIKFIDTQANFKSIKLSKFLLISSTIYIIRIELTKSINRMTYLQIDNVFLYNNSINPYFYFEFYSFSQVYFHTLFYHKTNSTENILEITESPLNLYFDKLVFYKGSNNFFQFQLDFQNETQSLILINMKKILIYQWITNQPFYSCVYDNEKILVSLLMHRLIVLQLRTMEIFINCENCYVQQIYSSINIQQEIDQIIFYQHFTNLFVFQTSYIIKNMNKDFKLFYQSTGYGQFIMFKKVKFIFEISIQTIFKLIDIASFYSIQLIEILFFNNVQIQTDDKIQQNGILINGRTIQLIYFRNLLIFTQKKEIQIYLSLIECLQIQKLSHQKIIILNGRLSIYLQLSIVNTIKVTKLYFHNTIIEFMIIITNRANSNIIDNLIISHSEIFSSLILVKGLFSLIKNLNFRSSLYHSKDVFIFFTNQKKLKFVDLVIFNSTFFNTKIRPLEIFYIETISIIILNVNIKSTNFSYVQLFHIETDEFKLQYFNLMNNTFISYTFQNFLQPIVFVICLRFIKINFISIEFNVFVNPLFLFQLLKVQQSFIQNIQLLSQNLNIIYLFVLENQKRGNQQIFLSQVFIVELNNDVIENQNSINAQLLSVKYYEHLKLSEILMKIKLLQLIKVNFCQNISIEVVTILPFQKNEVNSFSAQIINFEYLDFIHVFCHTNLQLIIEGKYTYQEDWKLQNIDSFDGIIQIQCDKIIVSKWDIKFINVKKELMFFKVKNNLILKKVLIQNLIANQINLIIFEGQSKTKLKCYKNIFQNINFSSQSGSSIFRISNIFKIMFLKLIIKSISGSFHIFDLLNCQIKQSNTLVVKIKNSDYLFNYFNSLLSIHQFIGINNSARFFIIQNSHLTMIKIFISQIKMSKVNGTFIEAFSSFIKITQSTFININKALFGGVIYFRSNFSSLQVVETKFLRNEANYGGAICNFSPYFIINNANNVFIDNLSKNEQYNNIIQYPMFYTIYIKNYYKYNLIIFRGRLLRNKVKLQQNLKKIKKGGQYFFEIKFFHNNEQQQFIEAQFEQSVILFLNHTQLNFITNFNTEFYSFYPKLSQIILLVMSYNNSNISQFNIQLAYRNCLPGEYLLKQNDTCHQCLEESYTSNVDQEICNICPAIAKCENGLIVSIQPGYWRDSNITDNIWLCLNRESNCNHTCIEGKFILELYSKGHIGPLCETCDIFQKISNQSYFTISLYECERCSKLEKNIKTGILSFLFLQISIIIVNRVAHNGIVDYIIVKYFRYTGLFLFGTSGLVQIPGSFVKLLINYIQLHILIQKLQSKQIEFMADIKIYFTGIFKSILSPETFTLECMYKNYLKEEKIIIWKSIESFSLMLILTLIQVIINLIFSSKKKQQLQSTLLFTLLFCYQYFLPQITTSIISSLKCRQIGQEYYVQTYLLLKCFNEFYKFYSLMYFLPISILFLLFIPIFISYQLKMQIAKNQKIIKISFALRYGILIIDLNLKGSLYEMIRIIQNQIFAIITVFLTQMVYLGFLLQLLLILVFIFIQQQIKPFICLQQRNANEKIFLNLLIQIALLQSLLSINVEQIFYLFVIVYYLLFSYGFLELLKLVAKLYIQDLLLIMIKICPKCGLPQKKKKIFSQQRIWKQIYLISKVYRINIE